MYYDRKNIEINFEYFFDIISFKKSTTVYQSALFHNSGQKTANHNRVVLEFLIENLGRRRLVVIQSSLQLISKSGELVLEAAGLVDKRDNVSELDSIM